VHLPGAVIVRYDSRQRHQKREECGMEKLLNSLTGTIIAGFVLTVILAIVIHAIR
jgi:hypothetical protein